MQMFVEIRTGSTKGTHTPTAATVRPHQVPSLNGTWLLNELFHFNSRTSEYSSMTRSSPQEVSTSILVLLVAKPVNESTKSKAL